MNYHKPEAACIKTYGDDRIVYINYSIVTQNGGSLSFQKQVHALILEHKIISKHPHL